MRHRQAREVFRRCRADLDACHALKIFERNSLAAARLVPSQVRTFEGARNFVQQLDHPGGIYVGLVDCPCEQ